MRRLLTTSGDSAVTVVRIVLGIVIFAHGSQKAFGWFGGHGVTWTITMWEQWFNLSAVTTSLVILGESAGALALVLGLLTRIMSAVIGIIMLGAVYLVHFKSGFFMNWYSEMRGEGYEYHILVLAMVVMLIVKGGGSYSIDRALLKRMYDIKDA